MTFAPLVLGAVGAVTSAVGAISAGSAKSSEASYQAQVARNNAQTAGENAVAATRAGEVATTNQSLKGAAQEGRIKTQQAASGLDVNSGSAVDVRASQAITNRLDTLNVMHNAALQAYGYRTEETNQNAQAGLDQAEASSAETGGILGAAGGLLGSASSLGFKWGGQTPPGGGTTQGANDAYMPG